MELRVYLRMLQQGWWLVVLTTLMALSASLVSVYLATPRYRASARLMVTPNLNLAQDNRDLVNTLEALDRRSIVSTYVEVLSSSRIYQDAATALNLSASDRGEYEVTNVVLPDSSILEVTVNGPNPRIVAELVNTVSQISIDYIVGLYPIYNVDFLDYASAPKTPYEPQPLRNIGLALALGVVVGAVLAILREQLREPLDALRRYNITDRASLALNRRYFQRCVESELNQDANRVFSLGLVRLNGLQDFIDTLPPMVSQRVLRTVTRTLGNELRGNDSIGRWDDVSFAILLPSTPSMPSVRTLERIRQALTAPITLDEPGETIYLEPQVGVMTGKGNQTITEVLAQAEAALEKARNTHDQVAVLD